MSASPDPQPPADTEHATEAPGALATALRAASGPVPTLAAAWLAAFLLALYHAKSDALLMALGFAGAVVAGMVGVGGAIVMIPLLLYVPPLLGQPALDIHTVSGITMAQVAAAGLAGLLGHVHHRPLRGNLIPTLGGGMMAGSLTGAALSSLVSGRALTAVFAALALAAAVLMLATRRGERWLADPVEDPANINPYLAVGGSTVVGLLAGMIGAGGGFLLVPLMIYVLRVPLRSAISASLGIVVMSAVAGMVGKAATGQIEWLPAIALVVGALPGARLGASVSRRMHTEALSLVLAILIGLVAAKMWWEILG
ncbi:MAG TPA: sulfite exporter TauE/SafE family protein [Gemmatimonadales bacterium]|nr:sulfite exporter TauE/SafE family protein [Gemmatimonadales bacterium]